MSLEGGPRPTLRAAAFDSTVDVSPGDFELSDYIGIAHQADGEGCRIWTSYMGMYTEDPTEHKTVIWSSQIPWASP